jgi:electron transfer flavoprotein beta subunit
VTLALSLTDDVVVLAAGDREAPLRRGLALGAARAVRVPAAPASDPLWTARALAGAVAAEGAELVVAGAEGVVGAGLAGLLGRPLVSAAREAWLEGDALRARRELGGGRVELVEADLPAVLTVAGGELRVPTLRRIKLAERAEVELAPPAEPGEVPYRVLGPAPKRTPTPLTGDPSEIAAAILGIVRERTA